MASLSTEDPPEEAATGLIRVLLVGPHSADAELLRALLEHSRGTRIALLHAVNLQHAFETLEQDEVDVLLMDVGAGSPRELVAVSQARVRAPLVPVVVMVDGDDEELAAKAVEVGARGYLVKCAISPGALVWSLQHAIRNQRMFLELNIARERARQLATYDQLTGFANRSLFQDRLEQAVASARRNRQKLAVLFVDLDQFKVINDSLGHLAGDALLQMAAQRIGTCLRKSDTGARLGGDEFAVLLTNLADEADAGRIADKVLAALREPIVLRGRQHLITASVGIATFPRDASSAEDLLKRADAAMYAAKGDGRDRYSYYTEGQHSASIERAARENRLRVGLDSHELAVFFQPVVDASRGRVVGAEALIRWRHPELGLMLPGQFLGLAEESQLIVSIGEWVLLHACRQAAVWQQAGHAGFRIAVNVSPQQFQSVQFVGMVRDVLHETGVRADSLELEITERSLLSGGQRTIAQFAMLRGLGVRLAIDDFGTGYSALAYLKQLPVDALKIDQSFVRAVATDPADATITSTIVQMARALNLTTIAEGVETIEQMQLLASYGCSRMQGHLFSEAVEPEAFTEILANPPFWWMRTTPKPGST
jgi:diguanylate cyclase (GGDEF)-like protein